MSEKLVTDGSILTLSMLGPAMTTMCSHDEISVNVKEVKERTGNDVAKLMPSIHEHFNRV